MNIAKILLKCLGWSVDCTVPDYPKCIISVAPHTTNLDFILGKLAYSAVGRKAGFLMKSTWFFFPLGQIFKAMGGIPVVRKNKTVSLTDVVIEKFRTSDKIAIGITPEGTRSRTANWHTGFLRIAHAAGVPIILGVIDGGTKTCILREVFTPTGDMDADMRYVKEYYSQFTPIHPEKFTI